MFVHLRVQYQNQNQDLNQKVVAKNLRAASEV